MTLNKVKREAKKIPLTSNGEGEKNTKHWKLSRKVASLPPFLFPWYSDPRIAVHRASYLCGRRSCRPPACERWCSDPADELPFGCSTEEEEDSKLSHTHSSSSRDNSSTCFFGASFDDTWMDPRRKESRFLQTGSRMSMQLKLRQAAGALAQDRACWRDQKHAVTSGGQKITRK